MAADALSKLNAAAGRRHWVKDRRRTVATCTKQSPAFFVRRWLTGPLILALGGGAVGCYDVMGDSSIYRQEGNDDRQTTGGAGGSTSTTTIAPECIPTNLSGGVDNACGVFVSSSKGKDTNPGTKEKPFATLAHAIASSNGGGVYVCKESFTEALKIGDDVTLYGGLDCAKDWSFTAGARTTWTATSDEVPLHLLIGKRATLQDVALVAADAAKEGGSSIAILAEAGTELTLAHCEVTAGNGAAGAIGATPEGTGTLGAEGKPGLAGCGDMMTKPGADGGQNTCDASDVSGGLGGSGTSTSAGGDGSDGIPIGDGGKGGNGQSFDGQPATACMVGGDGGAGLPGASGDGASEAATGTISIDGYAGSSGADGASSGTPGQGGGGGGGAKKCAGGQAGPSAGGGGAAGCGGAPGKGGRAGGASIAILSLNAQLTFLDVQIATKSGGKGGDGGLGQPGGSGGAGGKAGNGDGTGIACAGGKGGDGGAGGRGGGGRGGPSVAVAYLGDAPDTKGATITVGMPGEGGAGDGDMGTGAKGVAAETQAF